MGKNIFYFERFLVVISSASARIYLFKVNNGITRIRCENCSGLKMKTLEQCQWCHSSVFIANCEHVSNFFLIVDFEELGSYRKSKHHWRQDRVYALFCCILSVNKIPLLTKYLNFIPLQLFVWIDEKFYFRRWPWPVAHFSFYRFLLPGR